MVPQETRDSKVTQEDFVFTMPVLYLEEVGMASRDIVCLDHCVINPQSTFGHFVLKASLGQFWWFV